MKMVLFNDVISCVQKSGMTRRLMYLQDNNEFNDSNRDYIGTLHLVVIPDATLVTPAAQKGFKKVLKENIESRLGLSVAWEQDTVKEGENVFFPHLQYDILASQMPDKFGKCIISIVPEDVARLRRLDAKYKPL